MYLGNITRFIILLMVSLAVCAVATASVNAQGLTIPKEQTPQQVAANCRSGSTETCLEKNPLVQWIEFGINVISVIIISGSAVMIAFAGVQYTAARDNPQQVQAAKQRMWNVGVGLISYFFLYGFIQWIIPGGVF